MLKHCNHQCNTINTMFSFITIFTRVHNEIKQLYVDKNPSASALSNKYRANLMNNINLPYTHSTTIQTPSYNTTDYILFKERQAESTV